jgi:hypothetical protein
VSLVVGHVHDAVAEQIITAVVERAARLFWQPADSGPHHECFKIKLSEWAGHLNRRELEILR